MYVGRQAPDFNRLKTMKTEKPLKEKFFIETTSLEEIKQEEYKDKKRLYQLLSMSLKNV
jgi:hypothetical protein